MRFVHALAFLSCAAFASATLPGCDEAEPALAKAGWLVFFQSAGGSCQVAPHNGAVGDITAATITEEVTKGQDEADISCQVSGSGTFSVKGTAIAGGSALTITIPKITTGATADKPVTGTLSYASAGTSGIAYHSDEPCNFYFANSKETVVIEETGRIWVSFDCPSVTSDMSSCSLEGVAVFENCSTGG